MKKSEYLVLWEVSQKQKYIFSSNRLKENRGGSIIIERIVTDLPAEVDGSYADCLIYNGGGSSLYHFSEEEEARDFIKKVSREVIKTYPGVEIFMVYEGYRPDQDKVTEVIDKLYISLEEKKSSRKYAGEQLSFGIERECMSTRLPATDYELMDGRKRFYSEEIMVKRRESMRSSDKFSKLVPQDQNVKEFDDLVGDGKNYLGIVHIDGNKMGLKFDSLKNYYSYKSGSIESENMKYIENLRDFSKRIEDLFQDAFKHMTDTINSQENRETLDKVSKISEGKFPLIPIIIAGDDITYAVNGQLAIESARIFLEYLEGQEIEIYAGNKTKVCACAGVAIVPVGYPFSRAYDLAEDLCDNAKGHLREDNDEAYDGSLIDWHIDQGDIFGSVDEIRREFYRAKDGKRLNMRPLYVGAGDRWNSFKNFKTLMSELDRGNVARSKIKELRDVLRMGEDTTELYLKTNKLDSYFSAPMGLEDQANYCFYKGNCIYYDPIETMDMYEELEV